MTKISELINIVREGIRVHDNSNAFILENELDSMLWKIRSGRQKDIDVSDTLRFKELINNHGPKQHTDPTH